MITDPQAEKPARPPGREPAPLATDRPMSGPPPGGLEQGLAVGARIIAPSLLMPAEVVIFELKPSLWYVVFRCLPVAVVGVVAVLLAWTVRELPDSVRHWGVILGSWAIGLRVAAGLLEFYGRTYVLTDRRILHQFGVVSVQVECMGLEEVETSFVAQAAAQRVLGIGTIFFRNTGPRCTTLAWEHLRRPAEVHARVLVQIERWKRALQKQP
jgi:hypothetical protein